MTVDLTSPASPFTTTLAQVAATQGNGSDRPNTSVVVNALLQAEKAAKQQRISYPIESLLGHWQLCFTATQKAKRSDMVLGRGWYIPKVAAAHISFSPSTSTEHSGRGEIGNQIEFGPLLFKLTGPFHYLGKKNLLAFDFTQMQLCLFGRTVYHGNFRGGTHQDFYSQSITKLPFFAFFLVTEEFIAARGRGGGLALWIRKT